MDHPSRRDLVVRLLVDRPGITAGQLAAESGASIRSVFRDLAWLRERGYPIESSRGRGGGLRLHPNWGLGRLQLSGEEALGLLLSLAVAERLGLPMFASDLARARRKVVSAFPATERRRLAPLRERILVGPPASMAVRESYRHPDGEVSRRLQSAFVRERIITASYVRADGTCATRRMEPHALMINWPAWYLIAHDHLRAEVRTFRLDRFDSVREEPEGFRPRPRGLLEAVVGESGEAGGRWDL